MACKSALYTLSAVHIINELKELVTRDVHDFHDNRGITTIIHTLSSYFFNQEEYRDRAKRTVEVFAARKHSIAVTITWEKIEETEQDWRMRVTYSGGIYANS